MNSLVKLSAVSKIYRRGLFGKPFFAIQDVDLSIAPGESVGFIGHNGAGKSSTIRIMMGLQRPSTGLVSMNGLSVCSPKSRRGVAYVPESPLAYEYLTPLEIVITGMSMAGTKPAYPKTHAMKWLERFGIAHAAGKPLRALSKGMVQRTMLAHALAVEPHLLVLDEPLSGLDPLGRFEVVEILQEYRKSGGALLFSSHILADIERLADRFVFIHKGSVRLVCGVYDMLSGAGQSFEVLAADLRGNYPDFDTWGKIAPGVWRKVVLPTDLAVCLNSLQGGGGRVLSIQNVNSLENTYIKLVQEAAKVAVK